MVRIAVGALVEDGGAVVVGVGVHSVRLAPAQSETQSSQLTMTRITYYFSYVFYLQSSPDPGELPVVVDVVPFPPVVGVPVLPVPPDVVDVVVVVELNIGVGVVDVGLGTGWMSVLL